MPWGCPTFPLAAGGQPPEEPDDPRGPTGRSIGRTTFGSELRSAESPERVGSFGCELPRGFSYLKPLAGASPSPILRCETPHMAMIDLVRRVARPFPGKRMAVGSLLYDGEDRLLIVDPTYRRGWSIPGGMVGRNESPRGAVEREVSEEVGLQRPTGRLLCVDYLSAVGTRSEAVMMIFDGGLLAPDEIIRIRPRRIELKGHALLDRSEALDMVEPELRKRVEAALAVRSGDGPCYLEDGHPVWPVRENPG